MIAREVEWVPCAGWCLHGFNIPRTPQGAPVVKNLPANRRVIGDVRSTPGLGRSPGEGNGSPLQHSCLENPMDRGAWRATVHGVTKSQTRLTEHGTAESRFTMLCYNSFYCRAKWTSYAYTYIPPLSLSFFFSGFPFHLGHHRTRSWVPWAIQRVFISYLIYT